MVSGSLFSVLASHIIDILDCFFDSPYRKIPGSLVLRDLRFFGNGK